MSASVGTRPCALFHSAATRGKRISAATCGRLAMPMGPRASAVLSAIPNSANASTNAPIAASEPWSITVPAQSKITALSCMEILLAEEIGDNFLGDRERGRGACAAGDQHKAKALGGLVDERQPIRSRGISSGPAFDDRQVCIAREHGSELVENELIDISGRERVRGRGIMV